jgi:hypothetical protein
MVLLVATAGANALSGCSGDEEVGSIQTPGTGGSDADVRAQDVAASADTSSGAAGSPAEAAANGQDIAAPPDSSGGPDVGLPDENDVVGDEHPMNASEAAADVAPGDAAGKDASNDAPAPDVSVDTGPPDVFVDAGPPDVSLDAGPPDAPPDVSEEAPSDAIADAGPDWMKKGLQCLDGSSPADPDANGIIPPADGDGGDAGRTPAHRAVSVACPCERPPSDPCEGTFRLCTNDSQCKGGPNGRCIGFVGPWDCACSYDACLTDDDCGPGGVCLCDGRGNHCVRAKCSTDADCGQGSLCKPPTWIFDCGYGADVFLGYACTTPNDTCIDDSDCAGGCVFVPGEGRWACRQIVWCNLISTPLGVAQPSFHAAHPIL